MGANRKVTADYVVAPLVELKRRGNKLVLGVDSFKGEENYELHDGDIQETPSGKEFIILKRKRRMR